MIWGEEGRPGYGLYDRAHKILSQTPLERFGEQRE
ncbi:hypothetical protein [Lentibacillus jeotgali]|nr:hypothetical protein [Lentibacillus jeotgali]